jgi:hypothetical protein
MLATFLTPRRRRRTSEQRPLFARFRNNHERDGLGSEEEENVYDEDRGSSSDGSAQREQDEEYAALLPIFSAPHLGMLLHVRDFEWWH